jgi:hypothetical protein
MFSPIAPASVARWVSQVVIGFIGSGALQSADL